MLYPYFCYDDQQESGKISEKGRPISSQNKVELYLPKQVFTHGELYVACSRVTQRDGLRVMIDDDEINEDDTVKNIVYKEIF
jgi:hypothetical protein